MGERRFQLPDGDIAFAPYFFSCTLYPSPDVPFFLHVLSPIILYLLFTSHWQSIGHHLYRMTRKKVVFIGRYDAIYWLVFLGLVV